MDIMGVNFFNVIEMMKERFGVNLVVIQVLIGKEDIFRGIVDFFIMKVIIYVDDFGKVL